MFFIIKKRYKNLNSHDKYYDDHNEYNTYYKPKYKQKNKISIKYEKFKNFLKSTILKN